MGGTEVQGLMKGWGSGRPCDSCRAAASVFCGAHSAFLCLSCDERLHPHRVGATRYERTLVCERAPAVSTCKTDAALLCIACDTDIHSANPLASHHERVAVEPFYDSPAEAIAKSTSASRFDGVKSEDQMLFFPEILEPVSLLDFEFHHLGPPAATDSLVPVQVKVPGGGSIIDFTRSNLSPPFDYVQPPSFNLNVSSSSVDVGVVPDGSSMSDITFPYIHNMTPSGDDVGSTGRTLPSSCTNSASSQSGGNYSCGVDREARVLRYREKRKNRKFEKTIRYASRKVYAESRPRIKGRFAKHSEPDHDLVQVHHQVFGGLRSSVPFVGSDPQYGVVPTF